MEENGRNNSKGLLVSGVEDILWFTQRASLVSVWYVFIFFLFMNQKAADLIVTCVSVYRRRSLLLG